MATKLKLGTDNNWATKVDKLLAYNDENGNFKPIQFDADRDSTSTRVNKSGLIENVEANRPRVQFDNNDGHLLLEPTRTNYCLNSNDASQWNPLTSNGTVTKTGNYATAPDGSQTATRLQASVTGSGYAMLFPSTNSISGNYSLSVYVKSNTGSNQSVAFYGRNTALSNYTITNEWQRLELSGSQTGGENSYFLLGINTAVGTPDNPIDILVWGGQLEAGTYATSLIPTTTAVTRTEDFCYINSGLQDILNTSEGTLFVDVEVPRVATTSDFDRIVLSDQTSSTDRLIFDNFGGNWRTLLLSSGNNVNRTIVSVTANQRIKVAIAYSSTQLRISYDGNDATTTSGTYAPTTTLESFKFSNKDGGSKWQGKIYQAMYFDTALTNAELKQLTS